MNSERIIAFTVNGQCVDSVKYENWHDNVFGLDPLQKETLNTKKTLTLPLNLLDIIKFHNLEKRRLELENQKLELEKQNLEFKDSLLTQRNLEIWKQYTQCKESKIEVEKGLKEVSQIATDEKMDIEERKSRIIQIKMEIEKHVIFIL